MSRELRGKKGRFWYLESVVSYSTAVPVQVGFIAQNKSDGAGTEKLKTAVADFLKPLLFLASSESIVLQAKLQRGPWIAT